MADFRQKAATSPLSPFLTIFRWPVTMATSIIHRATGAGLTVGAVVLAWWLFAIAGGPESYGHFYRQAATPVGKIVLYGCGWALSYHFYNGIRHLCWDFGIGFEQKQANRSGILVIAASIVTILAIFLVIHFGLAGYYDEP